jgi:hypothetical protein
MAARRRRQQRPPKKQTKPTGVTLTPAQAKVVRALARDRQRTVDEANRMLAEAEAALQELADTYAALYGLAREEDERFDFEPAGDEITLKTVPREQEPPSSCPTGPASPDGEPEQEPEGDGGESPPAETPPEE